MKRYVCSGEHITSFYLTQEKVVLARNAQTDKANQQSRDAVLALQDLKM